MLDGLEGFLQIALDLVRHIYLHIGFLKIETIS